jgi:hypothetical protein
MRPPRVAIDGARLQFANALGELINISPTGALIRVPFELRQGGEWPLLIELPDARLLRLNGRVVRCRRDGISYLLALAFVSPAAEAHSLLNDICSTPLPATEKRSYPLPWRPPPLSLERLLRIRVASERQCPECHCPDVTKEQGRHYSCDQCGRRFSGFRIGGRRISL